MLVGAVLALAGAIPASAWAAPPAINLAQGPSTTLPSGASPRGIVAAQLNGTGNTDLATANEGTDQASILLNAAPGPLFARTDVTVGDAPRALAAGDFNGDGDTDLVVANSGNTGTGNSVTVLENNGAGVFSVVQTVALAGAAQPWGIAVGRLNNDATWTSRPRTTETAR